MESKILNQLMGEKIKNYENTPLTIAENVGQLLEWIKNPLNKMKIELYKNSILITGNTYEFKEDLKKWFNACFNKSLKGWLIFSSNENFELLKGELK